MSGLHRFTPHAPTPGGPGWTWGNWSGLVRVEPRRVVTPSDTEATADAVRRAADAGMPVRMVGAGHSFTPVAATDGMLLLPDRLKGLLAVDRENGTVTVRAGTPLHALNRWLAAEGLALANVGDVDRQTVAGAIATGTHGTGGSVASLSAQVAEVELVLADGTVTSASPAASPDLFAAARLGLGAVGVLTAVTFHVVPAFTLRAVEQPMPWGAVTEAFTDLVADNDHFEFYWWPHTDTTLTKQNNRVSDPARPLPRARTWLEDELLSNTLFEGLNRVGARWPAVVPALNRVAARSLSARSYSDSSPRVFCSPRRVRFREMEYAVPRDATLAILDDVRSLIARSGWRVSFPVEVRTAPADDVWLSTAYRRDSTYLAFHVYASTDHTDYFQSVERLLAGYGGRPHWGKLHTRAREDLEPVCPGLADFCTVRDRVDPDRVFGNDYLARVLGD